MGALCGLSLTADLGPGGDGFHQLGKSGHLDGDVNFLWAHRGAFSAGKAGLRALIALQTVKAHDRVGYGGVAKLA